MGITLSANWLKLKVRIAICVQIVDGGPKGFGAVASFTGGDDWGIGKFQVYGSIGFIWGAWKTGSDSNGIHAWAQVGFKMSVFYVFSVGMEIDLDLTYLKSPWYVTLAATIHIDTPVVPARRLIPDQQDVEPFAAVRQPAGHTPAQRRRRDQPSGSQLAGADARAGPERRDH